MKVCSKCQLEYDDKFAFCQKCGNKLEIKEGKQVCSTCGNVIETDGEFCPYCGTSLITNQSSDVQQNKNVQNASDNRNFTIQNNNLSTSSKKAIGDDSQNLADNSKTKKVQQNIKPNQTETISEGNNDANKTPFEIKFLIIAIVLCIAFLWVINSFDNDDNLRKTAVVPKFNSVMLYSSMQEDQLNAVKKAFEKKYPNIKMDYYFAGSGRVITKIATEAKSGQVRADLIWVGSPTDFVTFKRLGILEKYSSPEAANIDKSFIDPEGFYTGTHMINMGIAYNTNKVKREEAPRTWNDLLNPKWKGQIVMTDPNTAYTTRYAVGALLFNKEYGPAFFEKLKGNGTEVQKGTTVPHKQIAAGAYKVGMCLDYVTYAMKNEGDPIDYIYLDKDIISIFTPVALIKGAKNTKDAKLLYDFIISKEGQEVLVANNLLSVRKDVKQKGENVETIAKRAMNVDLNALSLKFRELTNRFDAIFGRLSNETQLPNQTISNEKALNSNIISANFTPVKVLNGTINLPGNFKRIENPSVSGSYQGIDSGIALTGEVEKNDSTEKDPRLNRFNVMVMFAKSADLLKLKSSEEEAALEATFKSYWESNKQTSKVATKRELISTEFCKTDKGHKYLKVKFISGIPNKPNIDLLHNVAFYIFGDTLYHIDLDTMVRANGKHDKDFETILNSFDAKH